MLHRDAPFLIRIWAGLSVSLMGLPACGVFNNGGFLDPVPNGTMLTKVSLMESGNPAPAGFVSVWKTGTYSYVVRLESLDLITDESSIQIIASVNGSQKFVGTLRAFSGTQNYSTTLSTTTSTWTAVTLTRTGNTNITIANASMSASYP